MTDLTKTQYDDGFDNTDSSDSTPSDSHAGTSIYLILHDEHRTYTVSAVFYNDVLNTVSEAIRHLLPSDICTLREIYGEASWLQMTRCERIKAGKCMAYMVANKRLPLHFIGCPHADPKKYRLR
jgi:hypothetical protein